MQQPNNSSQINKDWFMRHKWFFAAVVFVIIGAGMIVQLKIAYWRKNLVIDLPSHVEKQNAVTTGWKIYSNKEYGVQFEYPAYLKTEYQNNNEISLEADEFNGLYFKVLNNPDRLALNTWLNALPDYYSKSEIEETNKEEGPGFRYKESIIEIANTQSLKQEIDAEGGSGQYIFIPREDKMYVFKLASDTHFNDQKILVDDFDQMLSTFKFINSQTSVSEFKIPFKVGDKMGSMSVISIEPFFPERNYPINEDNYRVKFKGAVTISGEYLVETDSGPSCGFYLKNLDAASEAKMPKVRLQDKTFFCPILGGLSDENFKKDGSGKATLRIDDYELVGCGCEGFDKANVTKINSVTPNIQ